MRNPKLAEVRHKLSNLLKIPLEENRPLHLLEYNKLLGDIFLKNLF